MMLIKGESYTATTTGTLNGSRIHHNVTFVASRDQDVAPFIRRAGSPDQDRVFCMDSYGSTPMLVVAGSIRPGSID